MGTVSNQQKAAQQRSATAYLIRLHRAKNQLAETSHLFCNRVAKGLPSWFQSYCSGARWVESRQLRNLPF